MEHREDLGTSLRALRRDRRLSLHDVSAGTGISPSFLSLVENGKSDLTIGRLMKLAHFFDVHVSDLLPTGAGRDPIVIRATERRHIASPVEGIDLYLLGPDGDRRMLPMIAELRSNARPAELLTHEGEEYVYVLDGHVWLEVEGHAAVILEQGDGAYYRAERPHRLSTEGETATVFAVASPPHL
jgi:transcriptional regulator with XRE-family HTH domain